MAKDKIKAMVRGKILDLTPVAFEMAKEYFGAVKVSELTVSKPIELTKPILIPKIKVTVEKPEELTKKVVNVEPPVVEKTVVKKKPVSRKKK